MVSVSVPWRSFLVVGALALAGLLWVPSRSEKRVVVVVGPQPCDCDFDHDGWLVDASERRPDSGRRTKGDIVWGMAQVKPLVAACQAHGFADVRLAIAADGHVTRASIVGSLAGTATGQCVEEAVLRARFRAVNGPTCVSYPFYFR